ncbi:LysR family transcriptional regulator [Streptacidiphilus jiangxiensis]|uniref:DNA-binding transcriptional regulator, LysR family n=1 Tax=Streptacidiphilus jiangxiensis TaxID=235985 RepID=A0A1H7W1C0_STRJI|nr:LysR family transcriptional regulator [Streptacidiphilus jiangxiensis]SEM15382.1 DNA-binding transcriptional regulator, LysR family [Streptacidiphilus jiangxiensis]
MELRQLRVFEAVVAHRTVTDAAAALGLAPSSVSEQIRALEQSFDVALFVRAPRGMTLTPAGRRLLPWARRLLGGAEEARQEVVTDRPELRLGTLETIAATHAPGMLARFAQRRPDVRVALHTDAARDGLLGAVAAGALEAAMILDIAGPLGELGFVLPPVPLDHLDLEEVPLALVAAPDHPLGGITELSRADLRGRPLLVDGPACSFHLAGERLLGGEVERVRAGGVAVTRACAERGLGMAVLPEFAVREELASGALVRLPLPGPRGGDAFPLRVRVVWRADREALPGLRAMLHAIAV